MRQIHLEWKKARSQSRIYNFVYDALEDEDDNVFDDPKKLRNLLRSKWNALIEGNDQQEITIGEYIDSYHETAIRQD